MKRRQFLKLSGAAAVSAFSILKVSAQTSGWPNKPVRLILPYAPGGATDLIGRPWADRLTQAFGQPFVIENRGGAGGMIGTEAVAKAAREKLLEEQDAKLQAEAKAQGMDEAQVDFWRRKVLGIRA